jgi:hypothetical protein
VQFVLGEGAARAKLVASISEANHASEALMYEVQAARDWLRDCEELLKAQKGLRFATYDAMAQAHHLSMVKGTTSEKKAKKDGLALIDDEQAKRNGAHRKYWSRLLIDAGVAPVNEGHAAGNAGKNTGKGNGKKPPKDGKPAAPIFASASKAAAYFQNEAAMMLRTLNANRRKGSISAKAVEAYKKAVADFQVATARAAKLLKK